jgi:glycogen debranching enzyme
MRPAQRSRLLLLFLCSASFLGTTPFSSGQTSARSLELSRPVRSWEFLPAVGTRAGVFGDEAGHFEAWVYPLKIVRDFHLLFHSDGRVIPGEALTRTVTVHPQSCTILYASETFQVQETIFVPVQDSGAVITLEVETAQPMEIEAAFRGDFQLEWPAALGGTYMNWDAALRAFYLGEEQKKFAALVGSPTAVLHNEEYSTNYSSSSESSFTLGPTTKGKDKKVIVIAASVQGFPDAENTYNRLSTTYPELLKQSGDYYRKYLDETVRLQLPDPQLQQAYDWARVSMVQGLVTNPYLGTGLIAGYRTSGGSQRPGFAWFFGRDALWTGMALNAEGDFATTRTALDFLSKYQRADGKIAHEISQGASFVNWFKDYPYPYASADATPLYIITMNDYVTRTGDVDFVRQKWDSLWKAYGFLKSTYDTQKLPQNFGIGHGWIEGGPLLPVNTELYQSGLGAQALLSLSNLAHLTGKEDVSKELAQTFATQKTFLNQAFWSAGKKLFSFALDRTNQRVEVASVLSTVPMWFGLLDEDKAEATLDILSDPDHETDWGMRIISSRDPRYNPGGYHFGSVWPLFTGWASVGEYRYHRALPAYSNLQANALLSTDGSLGHVTEVLSGDYYQGLSTSSPHQIWSAAMVVSPLLRGMMGLESDAFNRRITFAPHVPYDWNSFAIENVKVANCTVDLVYRRSIEVITLEAKNEGADNCGMEFSPSLDLRAQVLSVELNHRHINFDIRKNTVDQHVSLKFPLASGTNTLQIRVRNDFGLMLDPALPPLGSRSEGLRVVSEQWSPNLDSLQLDVAGRPGRSYSLGVWNPTQLGSVEGATFEKTGSEGARILVQFAGKPGDDYVHSKIILHFGGRVRSEASE